MAYKDANGFDHASGEEQGSNAQTLQITGNTVDLPHESFVRDADISRDGADLVLDGPDGTIIVESYFSGIESPALIAPNGATLSPELVNSFASSGNQYAQNMSMNDASPIGAVQEISGNATITRGDGSTQELSIGSPVYQGDIIETDSGSAVNVAFVDESSFAVSEETRLAIDEYVFDPSSQGGVQNFSVLKGVFVYTSGLIGREDPDDVSIETPVGSIGIRGTIIAGDVNDGEITVIEGAIVLRSPGGEEMTLASQFETGRFGGNNGIQNLGQKSANDVVEKFSIVSTVAPNLFSSINDAAAENAAQTQAPETLQEDTQEAPVAEDAQTFDADGATDQNGDSEVDGTVDEGADTSAADGDSDGAAMNTSADSSEDVTDATSQTQDMNPMAMQIAQAMGMMNGPNGAPMMGGNAQGMGSMATMAMASDNMMMNDQTMMEKIMDAESMMDRVSQMQESTMGDIIDPSLIPPANNTPGATGIAPVNFKDAAIGLTSVSIAPEDFFASGEDYTWNYNFAAEFTGSGTTGFELSANTLNAFTDLVNEGILHSIPSPLGNNGSLTLEFTNDFSGSIADGASRLLLIEIAATNANGTSAFSTYNFNIYNDTTQGAGDWAMPANDISGASGTVFNSPAGISSIGTTIGDTSATHDIKVFFGDDNDIVEIGGGNTAKDNIINLGSGNNTITTQSGTTSINNTIIGGNQTDKFTINEVENNFHGLGGDDTFKINITYSGAGDETIDKLNNNSSDILIDGGTSAFRALNVYETGDLSQPGQRGDTLELTGTDTIDFRNINDDFIKSIERIELGSGNQTVKLSYDDVVNMTDGRNTLLISGDSGDNLSFFDFSTASDAFTFRGSQDIDDTEGFATSNTSDDTTFDIYSNGDVTLLIEQSINIDPSAAIV